MYHVKLLIMDEYLVSTGSTNFENRSFSNNNETNLNVYDTEFALQQIEVFNQDIHRSRQVSLQEWKHRPSYEKSLDFLASIARGQL